MALVEDIIFRNPHVTEKLEQMFNNKRCCDTMFLVNQAEYHASSHLITVSSAKLDSIVDTHFQNCGDREIRIGPVKHDESFLVLLKYMYGVPINFTQMDKAVMCEVLSLSEVYKFTEFSKELKNYFSQLNCFNVDSLVVLLNTSKKFNIKELYEKCSIFAYNNTDAIVKHESFVNLQYDVLCDLLKADWFYTKEIDILRSTLDWHSENVNKELSHDESLKDNASKVTRSETLKDITKEAKDNQPNSSTKTILAETSNTLSKKQSLEKCNSLSNKTDSEDINTYETVGARNSNQTENCVKENVNETISEEIKDKCVEIVSEEIMESIGNLEKSYQVAMVSDKESTVIEEENEPTSQKNSLTNVIITSGFKNLKNETVQSVEECKSILNKPNSVVSPGISEVDNTPAAKASESQVKTNNFTCRFNKELTQVNPSGSTSGFSKKLVKLGSWGCTVCFVMNSTGDKCIACGSTKTEFVFNTQLSSTSTPGIDSDKYQFGSITFPSSPVFKKTETNLSKEESGNIQGTTPATPHPFSFSLSPLSKPTGQSGMTNSVSSLGAVVGENDTGFIFEFSNIPSTNSKDEKSGPDSESLPMLNTLLPCPAGLDFESLTKSSSPFSASNKGFKRFPGAGTPLFSTKPAEKSDDSYCSSPPGDKDDSVTSGNAGYSVPSAFFQPVIPMPDLITVVTGEEACETLWKGRCTLLCFVSGGKEWKERGVGVMKLLRDEEQVVRLVMRRDQVYKVCCNQRLTRDFELKPLSTSDRAWTWYNEDFSDGEPKRALFALKFRTCEHAKEFCANIESVVAELKTPTSSTEPSTDDTSKASVDVKTPVSGCLSSIHETTAQDFGETSNVHEMLVKENNANIANALEEIIDSCSKSNACSTTDLVEAKDTALSNETHTDTQECFTSENSFAVQIAKSLGIKQKISHQTNGESSTQTKDVIKKLTVGHSHSEATIEFPSNATDQTDVEICAEANISTDLVRRFSYNILKCLLSHIRITQITALEMIRLVKSQQYVKYREFLEEEKYFSHVSSVRQMCVQRDGVWASFVSGSKVCRIVRTFTVEGAVITNSNTLYESVEEYLIEDFKWKIGLKGFSKKNTNQKTAENGRVIFLPNSSQDPQKCSYEMHLKCTGLKNRQCTVECQMKMVSPSPDHPTLVLPLNKSSKSVTFAGDSLALFDTFFWSTPGIYSSLGARTFEVVFSSFDSSLK